MDLSCKRGGWAVLMAVLVLLTAGLFQGRAEIAHGPPGDSPPLQEQRQEGQMVVPASMIQFHEGRVSVRIRNAPWGRCPPSNRGPSGGHDPGTGPARWDRESRVCVSPTAGRGLLMDLPDAHALLIHTPRPQAGSIPKTLIRALHLPAGRGHRGSSRSRPGGPDSLAQTADATLQGQEAQRELDPATEEAQDERLAALCVPSPQQGDIEALQQAVFDPDQIIQATAFELLSAEDRQAASDTLVQAARSEQPPRRLQALSLLHQTGQADELTVLSVLEEALADHDVTVKSYAIQALAERGGADAIEVLRQALHDPDVAMKKVIIEKVVQTAQGHALLQEALSDEDKTIRSLAAFWLEEATLQAKASQE